jgi:hypothetical protein
MLKNYYNEIPFSDLNILKKIKNKIENTNFNSSEYNQLLKSYYEELDDLFPF